MPKTIFDPQSFAEYLSAMEELTALDNQNAFDKDEPALNDDEKVLDAAMAARRDALLNGKYVRLNAEPTPYPPLRPFYEHDVRGTIEADAVFELFRKMPKGGNLHIHSSATLSADCFVKMLLSDTLNGVNGRVAVYLGDDESRYKKYSLFYVADGAALAQGVYLLREAVSRNYLTPEKLVDMLTFSSERIKDVPYIWDEFNNIFARVSNVLKTFAVFREYYRLAFLELIGDNIDYAELRFGPSNLTAHNAPPFSAQMEEPAFGVFPEGDTNNSIETIRQIYYDVRTTHPEFLLKLILSDSRKKSGDPEKDVDNAIFSMKQAVKWKGTYKDVDGESTVEFIVGYDLVSEEDRGCDTGLFAQKIYESGLKNQLPFYFHDGESLWADNRNLFAAYLLGTKRVGHGINLYRFPAVLDCVKEKKIALEICPISNQLLRYAQDLRVHPIAEYLKRGVQCVICSDDPQIFNYSGLSHDFWEVYYATLIDLKAIRALIRNSYTYSAMNSDERTVKLYKWQIRWDAFVKSAVELL